MQDISIKSDKSLYFSTTIAEDGKPRDTVSYWHARSYSFLATWHSSCYLEQLPSEHEKGKSQWESGGAKLRSPTLVGEAELPF